MNTESGGMADDAVPSPPRPAYVTWTLAAFAILYLIFISRTVFTHQGKVVGTLFDDAFISMRFAHNLASGYGLVWNPGESPAVEGYTNLGWTLIMSGIMLAFPKLIAPVVLSILGSTIMLASGLLARRVLCVLDTDAPSQLCGIFLVLGYFPLVFWTLRGMEVGFVAVLLLLAVALALTRLTSQNDHSPRVLAAVSVLAGVAFLTRNDSIVLFAVVIGFALWWQWDETQLLPALAPLAICVFTQIVFRYQYYGDLVPNTYVLKMTGVPLLERLSSGSWAFMATAPALIPLLGIIATRGLSGTAPHRTRAMSALALVLFAVQASYLIWVGGDAWTFDFANRFIATVVPVLLVAVIAASQSPLSARMDSGRALWIVGAITVVVFTSLLMTGILDLAPRSHWTLPLGWLVVLASEAYGRVYQDAALGNRHMRLARVALAVGAAFLLTSSHAWGRWIFLNAPAVPDDIAFAKQGLMLRDALPRDAVIAASWLGAPSYFSGLRAVDLLGKTDKYIAHLEGTLPFRPGHNKMDLAYSIGKLRPDVVLFMDVAPTIRRTDPSVFRRYGYERLPNGLWVDREFVKRLANPIALGRSWCDSPTESSYCPRG